jgi:hypothetical protein
VPYRGGRVCAALPSSITRLQLSFKRDHHTGELPPAMLHKFSSMQQLELDGFRVSSSAFLGAQGFWLAAA